MEVYLFRQNRGSIFDKTGIEVGALVGDGRLVGRLTFVSLSLWVHTLFLWSSLAR